MVSPYFNHVECKEEQDLYHDLARETIYLGGVEVLYIRVPQLDSEHLDRLFLENRFEELKKANAYVLDMWIANPPNHIEGQELFAKFGFSQAQQCTFYCAVRYFREVFGDETRPEEGSYIFVPRWKNDTFGPEDMWKINSVTVDDETAHALGSPLHFRIHTERAKYTHQQIEDLHIEASDVAAEMLGTIKQGKEVKNDDDILEQLGKDILEFDEKNPFGNP